jgi:hypothetical protein
VKNKTEWEVRSVGCLAGNSRNPGLAVVLTALCVLLANGSRAEQPVVAIHDSELTRALETIPAGGLTPSGAGVTGYQWWPTNWHYFVMPDSAKEMLRSDGTAFTVVSDANISAGSLLDSNGAPAYPIVISLACEALRDDEIAPLTNYVAAGGFLLIGSSSFTRNTNGTTRGDFAFATQMGLHMASPALTNWGFNNTFTRVSGHPLVAHIPEGTLSWQLPMASEEISWPEVDHVPNPPTGLPHLVWLVRTSGATVIAQGDTSPYVTVMQYGKGYFIYVAAMQPLLGHGGWAPGMYTYGLFRNAIQWAFESATMPVPKVSPWPFAYDAAIIFRHDMEAVPDYINAIENSARFEYTNGATGDYFFCTGELRENMPDAVATIASLQAAVSNYHATIGPHNGGFTNVNTYVPALTTNSYDYWHWGPDEVLNLNPPGYANGEAFALTSLSNAFADIQGWLPGTNNGGGLRISVTPYFNATREASLQIQQQLGIQIAGDEKLGPFPHWTLSTQTPDKNYTFASLPVSDWFVGPQIGQAMEDGHTIASVDALIDFYYSWGALINLYSHSSSDGTGAAGAVASEYVTYGLSKPRIWSANAVGVYTWWLQRKTMQIIPTFSRNGNQSIITVAISGAGSTNAAIEILAPNASVYGLQVFTNGVAAGHLSFRINGQVIKLLVGTSVTNAQIQYYLPPTADNDFYLTQQGTPLTVPAPGVLSNDTASSVGGSLTATLISGPTEGSLNLNGNGGFTYTPTNRFFGVDEFTYGANDAFDNSTAAVVTLMVNPPGDFLYDNFDRSTNSGSIAPWVQQTGAWNITNGTLTGTSGSNCYGDAFYANDNWTDYFVQGEVQFSSSNVWGGGIGGRIAPATGSHYAAWIYPEGSGDGSNVLKLIKFEGWTVWSHSPMGQASLSGVGTNLHTLKLAFQGSNITVYFDGVQEINATDANVDSVAPFTNGGIIADMFTYPSGGEMMIGNVSVGSSNSPPVIRSILVTNGVAAVTWSAIGARTYTLQWRTGQNTNWNDVVPDVLATGSTATATNILTGSSQRFYRVSLQP